METNYFVCTLGQAALPGVHRPFRDINHLIDQQAVTRPDSPAVGFYLSSNGHQNFDTQIVTFSQVLNTVSAVAEAIAGRLELSPGQTVGLLCNSSPAFLFTWLGLIRLGHPVLLIAPQCSASAVVHLSKTCEAPVLFHDAAHEDLAKRAVECSGDIDFSDMSACKLPYEDDTEVLKIIHKTPHGSTKLPETNDTDVAYFHHTSGTSSGIPKPIPQTHRGGVAVLPYLDGSGAATFTTTPLYHGGVADLFRAWTSSAMIWLFPAQHVPITSSNIVKCLEASEKATQQGQGVKVKYFSSVPYVLQMMAQHKEGLQYLQQMDIVGVGGAALPPEIGSELVENNINLVSRYGSAECGFLMSSHRAYDKDKDWQHLRKCPLVKQLKFETQDDQLSELVVQPGWPHMAKANRDDGSYATSDLFAPHPSIPDAWKYHSRADSLLSLITGKKFDPSPLEGSLAASSVLIDEALIFGNGKPYPGALLFRSMKGKDYSDTGLVHELAAVVEKLNAESQTHARIPRSMLVPMPYEPKPLEKSSKGTILRGKAEDKYKEQIENAYEKTTFTKGKVKDSELADAISKIVLNVVGDSRSSEINLTPQTDLFAYGVDSVACIQIRHALSQLLPSTSRPLPLTVVEDAGTISRLSNRMLRYRRGETVSEENQNGSSLSQIVKEYSNFGASNVVENPTVQHKAEYSALLTGPTGLLGAHVLSQLLADTRVKKIHLLIRGATAHAAAERVKKSLASRKQPIPPDFDQKVHVMPCKLGESQLGLSDQDYNLLTDEVDIILHLAWSVNFLLSLRSLATTHLAGLQNLLNLAIVSKRQPKFIFCSSVASVSNLIGKRKIPASVVDDVSSCGATGYSQSKLVAELICQEYAVNTCMRNRITIIRVGQLSGDTKHGIWNASEAYPLMFASSKVTGVLPDLKNEVLGWLPVDVAATCFIEAAMGSVDVNYRVTKGEPKSEEQKQTVEVVHLLNISHATWFKDAAEWIQAETQDIEIVPVAEWLEKLTQLQDDESTKDHPALKLLPFWNEVYGVNHPKATVDSKQPVKAELQNEANSSEGETKYEMTLSREVMPTLKQATGPLSKEYVLKLWRWVMESID